MNRRARNALRLAATVALASALAGCGGKVPGVYRIDVQQGNVLEPEALARLEPGMSKRKVRFLVGTPSIRDVFHQDRWDYVYTFQPGGGKRVQRRVSFFFEDDKLARIEGDVKAGEKFDPVAAPAKERIVDVPEGHNRGGLFGRLRSLYSSDEKGEEGTDSEGGDRSGPPAAEKPPVTGAAAAERASGQEDRSAVPDPAAPAAGRKASSEAREAPSPTASEPGEPDDAEPAKPGFLRRLAEQFGLKSKTESEAVPASEETSDPQSDQPAR